jgi:hypothetical protein
MTKRAPLETRIAAAPRIMSMPGSTTQRDRDLGLSQEEAKKYVCARIRERLEQNVQLYPNSTYGGLRKEDVQDIYDSQPCYLVGSMYTFFTKNKIKQWGTNFFGRLRNRATR